MQTQLGKWGNSTGLRIPAEMPEGGLLIRPVAQAQPRSKTPAEWAEQLRALQRSMPVGHSVVRQMRDEEL